MSSDISAADLEYIENLFDAIDVDGNGTISLQEFTKGYITFSVAIVTWPWALLSPIPRAISSYLELFPEIPHEPY